MVTDDLPSALDQLASFGRSPDVAIRPVLLRVMVDMFSNKPHHTPVEIRQFEEILSHILGDADATTRLAVAKKLSGHPQSPKSLLDRLIADRGAIASAVIARGAVDPDTLDAEAVLGTTDIALAAAKRPDLDPATVRRLAERPEAVILHALVGNIDAPLSAPVLHYLARRARNDNELAAKLLGRPGAQAESAALFLSATRAQRAAIMADARRRDLGTTGRSLPLTMSHDAITAVERASKLRGLDGLDVALATLLGLSHEDIDQIMDDRDGEPLALALAAIGTTAEVAGRIFILGDPAGGHSYQRVKALVGIVQSVSPRAAFRLVMGMLGRSTDMLRRAALPPQAEASQRRGFGTAVRAEPAAQERAVMKVLGRNR